MSFSAQTLLRKMGKFMRKRKDTEQCLQKEWLLYYNRVLRDKGLISEETYHRMSATIRREYRSGEQAMQKEQSTV